MPETPSTRTPDTGTTDAPDEAPSRRGRPRPDWRWAAAVLAALVWGLAAGWWTPRGPLTTGQALWSVGLSLAVGGFAGWASRSRWSTIAAAATRTLTRS